MSKPKHRADSDKGRHEITRGKLSGPPTPPAGVTISKGVQPFWDAVTTAKAKRAWTNGDLVMAADVARCMYRLERISATLESQPDMELEKLADMLAKRVRMLSVTLQIHPLATQGKAVRQVAQNEAHHSAGGLDDDLIAKPTH